MNQESKRGNGTLFIVSAPSGGGKTTLVETLMRSTPKLKRVVTHTTREARAGEVDGEDYHFVSLEEFKALNEAGGFLEHAEVFGNYYGTSKAEVLEKSADGSDVVLVIDWQGAAQVKALMPEAVSVFIVPPSIDALRTRLTHRNLDSSEIVDKRMKDAINQIKHYDKFDYLIVNDDFDIALVQLRGIFLSNRLRMEYQQVEQAELLASLLNDKVE